MADRILIQCPGCSTKFAISDESKLGKKIRCSKCSEMFVAKAIKSSGSENSAPTKAAKTKATGLLGKKDEFGKQDTPESPAITRVRTRLRVVVFGVALILVSGLVVWTARQNRPENIIAQAKNQRGGDVDLPNAKKAEDAEQNELRQQEDDLPDAVEKKSLEALIAATEPAIVRIDVNTREGSGIGSGFVIDDAGIVVTNHHVIDGATSAKTVFADGTTVPVIGILGTDAKRDIAILKIQKTEKKLVSLKLRKAVPQKGQAVVAFGAPQGLSFSASEGIVSAVRSAAELKDFGKPLDGEWIQTTTPISPGNSGGPLVDLFGQVVGINTFNLVKGQNLNFAVSAADIKRIYEETANANPLPLAMSSNAGSGLDGKEIRSLKIPPRSEYEHKYRIAAEKGKFDTYRRVELGPIELDKSTTFLLVLTVNDDERVSDNGILFITSVATDWRFRDYRPLKLLIDNELINLGEMNCDEKIAKAKLGDNGVWCVEKLTVTIPLSLILRFGRAKRTEFAIGNNEYALNFQSKNAFRDLLSRLPTTKTASGIALEIDEQLKAEIEAEKEVKRLAVEAERLAKEEDLRRKQERSRFEIADSSKSKDHTLYKVLLLSREASALSVDELSDIALKVSKRHEDHVWFFLSKKAVTEKPWAVSTPTPKAVRPTTRFLTPSTGN